AAPAGCLEVVGDEQHLDATLHERTQHPVEPGDAAVARTDGVAQPLDGGRLLLPLDLRLDLHRSKADVVVARVPRNGDARRDALAKVGVELTLELAGDVGGRGDDEVVEAGVLVDIERDLRGAAQMLLGTSRGVVTHVILLPVAPVVVVAWKLVEAFALVDELTELEHEEPRALSIGQQDRETLVLVD